MPKIKKQRTWPTKSAASRMVTDIPLALPHETLGEIEERLTKEISKYETINYIYVISEDQKLIGVFSIKELFRGHSNTHAHSLIKKRIISVPPLSSAEGAAIKAVKHNIKAIPVTDPRKKLLGVIPSDRINKILHNTLNRTVLQTAGISTDPTVYEDVLGEPILNSFSRRIPWLLIGMVGGIFLASIIGLFEGTLRENLLLAGFIPVITYISNAVAIQVQIIFIRDLAIHNNIPIGKYITRQLIVSFMIAVAASLFLIASAVFGWAAYYLLFVIGVAMMFSIMFAVMFALIIPITLKKMKFDPGIASGPFSTIIQDISSIVIYFAIASLLL